MLEQNDTLSSSSVDSAVGGDVQSDGLETGAAEEHGSTARPEDGGDMQSDGLETGAAEEPGSTAGPEDGGIADDDEAAPRESPNDDTETRWSKRSRVATDGVGATAIPEPAPQLNRRFFLGLNRASARFRARQRRETRRRRNEGGDAEEQRTENDDTEQQNRRQQTAGSAGRNSDRRRSSILRFIPDVLASYNQDLPIRATLVQEESQGEIVEAKRVGFFEGHWKLLFLSCLLLLGTAITLGMLLGTVSTSPEVTDKAPTAAPTYDPRPTLEIIQSNGFIRCGMDTDQTYRLQLCRAVAAVLFGDPDKYRLVKVTSSDRFIKLQDRQADLLLFSDTHTMEREVNERTTGDGFTFSDPYYFSGLGYLGYETYVKCAEQQIRYE